MAIAVSTHRSPLSFSPACFLTHAARTQLLFTLIATAHKGSSSVVDCIGEFVASNMPSILDIQLLDEAIMVTNVEAVEMAKRIALEEGLLVEISLGAAAAISFSNLS